MLRTAGHKKSSLASENLLGNELSSWVLPFFEGDVSASGITFGRKGWDFSAV